MNMSLQARRSMVLYACLIVILQPASAFAYIDPSSGGLLFQILAPLFAAIVGGWVFLRRAIARVLQAIKQRLTGKADR